MSVALLSQTSFANDDASYFEFDASFIQQGVASRDDKKDVNISRFFEANAVSPGKYDIDLYVNDLRLGLTNVAYKDVKGKSVLCFDQVLAKKIQPLLTDKTVASESWQPALTDGCHELAQFFPKAEAAFDLNRLVLTLNIPQAHLKQVAADYIPPSLWQENENSAFVRYYTNTFYRDAADNPFSLSLNLGLGANVGKWAFRHSGSYASGDDAEYAMLYTYAQRDLPKYNSQLLIGDFNTEGILFDSISLRGAQVRTDDRMLPASLRGFSPRVQGIAKANAKVTIVQNGNQIYHRSVPAGAYAFTDIPSLGYSGDLLVVLEYADGTEEKYSVPNTGVATMLRPGQIKYQGALGQIRRGQEVYSDVALQATAQYGVSNFITANAGMIASDGYYSGLVGATLNTPVGSFTSDVAVASAAFPDIPSDDTIPTDELTQGNQTGFTARLNYNTKVESTDTNVNLAAYRYSSENYYRLEDWVVINNSDAKTATSLGRTKNQLQLSVNQPLGQSTSGQNNGSLFMVGIQRDFWGSEEPTREYQLGYGNNYKQLQYGVFYRLNQNPNLDTNDQEFSVSFSMPLDFDKVPFHSMTSRISQDIDESTTQLFTSASGTRGKKNQWNYGMSIAASDESTTIAAQTQYRLPFVQLSANASASDEAYQLAVGASGGVVFHKNGVIMSNQLSDTYAIVEAKGATGAIISDSGGNEINKQGYGIMPNLSPYSYNTVGLDTINLPLNVSLESTLQEVIPRANSSVKLSFKASDGKAAMIEMTLPDGDMPPFGSQVTNEKGDSVAWVGQGGQIYLQDAADTGRLLVNWGAGAKEQCELNYSLSDAGSELSGIYMLKNKICQF